MSVRGVEPAVPHPESPSGASGHLGTVCNHEKRQTLFTMEPIEEVEHAAAGRRIEIPRRLIGEEQQRIVGKRPGDGDTLPFADGQFRRKMPRPMRHADQREKLLGPTHAFPPATAVPRTWEFEHFRAR